MNKTKEEILKIIDELGQKCLESGTDMFVVLTYKQDIMLKTSLQLSKHDIIFGKIVLTYKNAMLGFKYIEFNPYKIHKRIKFKDNRGENQKYFILYLPQKNKYCIQVSTNPVLFDTARDAEKFLTRYEGYDKFDRDWKYGITKQTEEKKTND